ncbi:uncharacterized protein K452DRAFT_302380 [Aplosporella prunicola CBS 121167]|uniref:CFEM domain-containing protein n=1 Tax=Aplosporella prunicola CBS 121167 TaxID=1176127 RepID=A0A6A6B0A0_9PEZI|nr:uncharacterized protein K452DRAFT_302380 [Aplosporella prunicola CBS 121167]KAF2136873.1 hypothetical protein K452DRAFT_302380 [Aplosporella prunicola CBS 121167]
MRIFWPLVVLASVVGSVGAQTSASASASKLKAVLAALPECGRTCLTQGIVVVGTCAPTDVACICTNKPLNTEVEACVASQCSVKNALTTKNVTQTSCGFEPRDRTKHVSYTGIIGMGIALIAIALRLVARLPMMGGNFGLDDVFLLVTMLPMIPLSVLSVSLAEAGLGKDMWTVSFKNITHILYIYYFDETLYLASLSLIKISILCFYLRIFPDKRFRWMCAVVIFCCFAYGVAFVVAVALQCNPINLSWKRWDNESEGHCVNVNALGWASATFNIVLDIAVITLPLPQLMKLALSVRKKIHVMFMFTVGSFVTVVSMLRLKWMIQFANSQNVTWDYVPIGYWSTIEVHAGIICACLPAIRALLYKLFPRVMGRGSGARSYGYGANTSGNIDTNTSIVQRVSKAETKDFIPLEEIDTPPGTAVVTAPKSGVHVSTRCYHT